LWGLPLQMLSLMYLQILVFLTIVVNTDLILQITMDIKTRIIIVMITLTGTKIMGTTTDQIMTIIVAIILTDVDVEHPTSNHTTRHMVMQTTIPLIIIIMDTMRVINHTQMVMTTHIMVPEILRADTTN